MNEPKTKAERFCRDILQLNVPRSKALANLVMALASFTQADSVVALSESPVFHYQYSSIFYAISELANSQESYSKTQKEIQQLSLKYFPKQEIYYFQTQFSTLNILG